jgi:hypothetical protein
MIYELRKLIVQILLAATVQKIRLFERNKTKIGPNGQLTNPVKRMFGITKMVHIFVFIKCYPMHIVGPPTC